MNRKYMLKAIIAFLYLALATNSLIADTTATPPAIVGGKHQISNLAELRWVSENDSLWNQDLVLTANIDATDTATWNSGSGFSPIGSADNTFTGSFTNAGSFTIDGLTSGDNTRVYSGFFGAIDSAIIDSIYFPLKL